MVMVMLWFAAITIVYASFAASQCQLTLM